MNRETIEENDRTQNRVRETNNGVASKSALGCTSAVLWPSAVAPGHSDYDDDYDDDD